MPIPNFRAAATREVFTPGLAWGIDFAEGKIDNELELPRSAAAEPAAEVTQG